MQTSLDNLRLIPFNDISHLDASVLYKATLTEDTDDAVIGWGLGYDASTSWEDATGLSATYANGGLKTVGDVTFTLPSATSEEQEVRDRLARRGTIQLDILLSELTAHTVGAGTGDIINLNRSTGTASKGRILQVATTALGGGSYRENTTGADGVSVFTNPVILRTSSTSIIGGIIPIFVIHDGVPAVDGFITVAVSWGGGYLEYFVNGVPVGRGRHDHGTQDVAADFIDSVYKVLLQRTKSITVRNLIILDMPRPTTIHTGGIRIGTIGHSFFARANPFGAMDNDGIIFNGGTAGAVESFYPSMYAVLIDISHSFHCIAKSGKSLIWMKDIVEDNYTSNVLDRGIVTLADDPYQNPVTRLRPHFCIIFGVGSDSGTSESTAKGYMDDITAKLVSIGCIPVWLTEQNRNCPVAITAGTDIDNTNVHGWLAERVTAWLVTYGDLGYADARASLGGDNCPNKYAEFDESTFTHPNLAAFAIYGNVVAVEIKRLIENPPTWSRLWKEKN